MSITELSRIDYYLMIENIDLKKKKKREFIIQKKLL
jgi:hypothetical protein